MSRIGDAFRQTFSGIKTQLTSSNKGTHPVTLKSTGALGDFILASALQHALGERGFNVGIINPAFAHPLWNYFPVIRGHTVRFFPTPADVPAGETVVDISTYLRHFPHSDKIPGGHGRKGHLSEWMGIEFLAKGGDQVLTNANINPNTLHVSPSNVQIYLTDGTNTMEVEQGLDLVRRVGGGQPVIVVAPLAAPMLPDRNALGPKDLRPATVTYIGQTIRALGGVPALQGPVDQYNRLTARDAHCIDAYAVIDRPTDIRITPALLLAADGVISVESAPIHLAAGAYQGTTKAATEKGLRNLSKIIAIVGSSSREASEYGTSADNKTQTIETISTCPIVAATLRCGNHGYHPPAQYTAHFQRLLGAGQVFSADTFCVHTQPTDVHNCMTTLNHDDLAVRLERLIRDRP